MTSNQRRAIDLAKGLLSGAVTAAHLSDGDWHLLLLGAGVNCQHAPLLNVAGRVLDNAERDAGYFANVAGRPTSSPQTSPPAPSPDFQFLMPADAPGAPALGRQHRGEHFYAQVEW